MAFQVEGEQYRFGLFDGQDHYIKYCVQSVDYEKYSTPKKGKRKNEWRCARGHFSNLVFGTMCNYCGSPVILPPHFEPRDPYHMMLSEEESEEPINFLARAAMLLELAEAPFEQPEDEQNRFFVVGIPYDLDQLGELDPPLDILNLPDDRNQPDQPDPPQVIQN